MSRKLSVEALRTPIYRLGVDFNLFLAQVLQENITSGKTLENRVLVITSKLLSLAEGRVLPKSSIDKETLVRREADQFLGAMGYGSFLTIKEGLLMPSAGIDESNAEGDFYILFPKDPFLSAENIRRFICEKWKLKNFGVILSDSHTSPLRKGVTGIALAHAGFRGIENKVGTPDLFGKNLKMTQVNVADALAVAAVFCMGESNESTPLALIESEVQFCKTTPDSARIECRIETKDDLYWPCFFK